MKFLLKERNVWLISVLGLTFIAACTPQGEDNGKLYNENGIRDKLETLDSDNNILYGKEIFNDTKETVPDNATWRISTSKDRVNGCFIRSMNGTELEEDSRELASIIKYFEFISEDVDSEDDITWRMYQQN